MDHDKVIDRDTILNNLNNNNIDILALTDVLNMIKNDSVKDNSVAWFIKTKDNYQDINNIYRNTILINAAVGTSNNSEVYNSLYTMYDNLCNFISSLLLPEKVVKKMEYQEYLDYMKMLDNGLLALDNIISLDNVQKNPSRCHAMKEKQRTILQKIKSYNCLKKNNKKELLKKGLTFAAGFVAGVGMSCVPGVGTIRMGIAATKITTSIINAWGDKHPNGKIAKVINKLDNNLNEKFPKITDKLRMFKNKMRNNNINVFVNGISVGYIVGNVFELVTGDTVFDFIGNKLNPVGEPALDIKFVPEETVTVIEPTPEPVTQVPIETTMPQIDEPPVTTIISETSVPLAAESPIIDAVTPTPTIEIGTHLNVSELEYGYYSSFDPQLGKAPLKLFNELGTNVHVGLENTLSDGTKMVALFQEDGTGYSWFKLDDIIDLLSKQSETSMQLVLK